MALDKIQAKLKKWNGPGLPAPPDVLERVDRGRQRMMRDASMIEMCWRFFRGDTYCWLDNSNVLRFNSVTTSIGGGGKEPHRVRQTPNIIQPVVRHEVSAATQKVPGYEVSPSTMDPEDVAAASLAKRVAYYGYDRWSLRKVTNQVVTYAVVGDMGFAWPYWDSYQGRAIKGENVGTGEICVKTFGLNECNWEPGLRFEDSAWHNVEQAMTPEAAMAIDGYLGGTLVADASPAAYSDRAIRARELVAVTDYLERPSPTFPKGRWLTLANGRVIAGISIGDTVEYRDYPCDDGICLIPLSYVEDPDSDRNTGLVRHLLDPQRTYQDAWSKALEWKNRCLNPQILAPIGSIKNRLTDAPGAIIQYVPVAGQVPQWQTVPPVPPSLFEIMDRSDTIVARISSQNDIPSQVEAGKAIQALIERDSTARQAFLANLAEFHSRLMRRCLEMVQQHYSEKRTLNIRGRLGWEPIKDFKGASLCDQVDVRVLPGSLTQATREEIQNKVAFIAQAFPGYLSPETAIAAMDVGTGEEIVADFESHQARANRIIQRIKDGTLMEMPMVPNPKGMQPAAPTLNPQTGMMEPGIQEPPEVPGWMPRSFDRIDIHKHVFESYMTSEEWEQLTPDMQHSALVYYDALEQIEQQKQAAELAQQSQMAAGLGAKNAATPGLNPMPSLPGGSSPPGGSPAS